MARSASSFSSPLIELEQLAAISRVSPPLQKDRAEVVELWHRVRLLAIEAGAKRDKYSRRVFCNKFYPGLKVDTLKNWERAELKLSSADTPTSIGAVN